jgi:hypothetical protein
LTHDILSNFYLINPVKGSLWHHKYLMSEKIQTRYGAVSADLLNLDWESKLPLLALMSGGTADAARIKLEKEGLMGEFMK